MKTSHIVLGIGAVVAGGAALWYFTKGAGAKGTYYPGSQGFPSPVPSGAPRNVQAPTPSGKGADTADVIKAATPLAIATLPYIKDAFSSLFGSDDAADAAPPSSTEGLNVDPLGGADYF
jgi:hypothetical protein